MQVGSRRRQPEHPVLVPVRLADLELVAERLQRADVGPLVSGVAHAEHQVDDRLGGESRDRGGAGVLEEQGPVTEHPLHLVDQRSSDGRPGRVRVDEQDWRVHPVRRPDPADHDLLLVPPARLTGRVENSVTCRSPGASSRAFTVAHGVRVGGATTCAPARASRSVTATESVTWNATRIGPATRRPTSTSSMNAALPGSVSSSVARPAARIVTRPSGEENAACSRSPRVSR